MIQFPSEHDSYFFIEANDPLVEELQKGESVLSASTAFEGCFLVTPSTTLRLQRVVSSNLFMLIQGKDVVEMGTNKLIATPVDNSSAAKEAAKRILANHQIPYEELVLEVCKQVPISNSEAKKCLADASEVSMNKNICSDFLALLLALKECRADFESLKVEQLAENHSIFAKLLKQDVEALLEIFCTPSPRKLRLEKVSSVFWSDLLEPVSSIELKELLRLFQAAARHYLPYSLYETEFSEEKLRQHILELLPFGLIVDYNEYQLPNDYNPRRVVFKKVRFGQEQNLKEKMRAIFEIKKTLTQQEAIYLFREFMQSSKAQQEFFQRYLIRIPFKISPKLRRNFLLANPLVDEDQIPAAKLDDASNAALDFDGMFKIKLLWM